MTTKYEDQLALEQWREIAKYVCREAGVPEKLIKRMDDDDLAAMSRTIAIIFLEKIGREANGDSPDTVISDDCE